MAEIYRDATGKAVALDVSNATSVTARLLRNGVVISTPTAVLSSGKWIIPVPYAITFYNGDFDVEWTYTVESVVYIRTDTHTVVTSLVPNAADPTLERIVRYVINGYTKNDFSYFDKTIELFGNDSDALDLPYRLDSLTSVTYGGQIWTPDLFFTEPDGNYLRKRDLRFLTIKDSPPDELLPISADGIIYAPGLYLYQKFMSDVSYLISAKWGYRTVPQDVLDAAQLLYTDYSCQDAGYRNKYIQTLTAGTWDFEFRSDAFAGTGNLAADTLLNKFRKLDWVVV